MIHEGTDYRDRTLVFNINIYCSQNLLTSKKFVEANGYRPPLTPARADYYFSSILASDLVAF